MSNGPIICCAAGVCCPPENPDGLLAETERGMTRRKAVAIILRESGDTPREMATGLLAKVDTTPKGISNLALSIGESGEASSEMVAQIVAIYKPFLEHRDHHGVGDESEE